MNRLNFDKLGTFASSLCAVHCLALGLAVGFFPALGVSFLKNAVLEFGFLALAVGFGVAAVIRGFRQHGSRRPLVFFVLGLGLLIFSVAMHNRHTPGGHHDDFGDVAVHVISMLGGVFLVYYHFLNQRLAKNCSCPICAASASAEQSATPIRR